jgi:MYXO-CTERM domain-containing protein
MKTRGLGLHVWLAAVAAGLSLVSLSEAGVIATPNAPFQTTAEVFTVDPFAVTRADRGLTTTRELYQTFKNPTTFDVKKIALSFRVTNVTTGLQVKFYEVADVVPASPTNIITSGSLGALIHTIALPAGTYGTSSERLGIELTGSDIFTLPQRDAGPTGYAISISQLTQPAGIVSGNFYFSNVADLYVNGRAYIETGAQSGSGRDFGVSISSAPEPTSVVIALLGLVAAWGASRRRSVTG